LASHTYYVQPYGVWALAYELGRYIKTDVTVAVINTNNTAE